MGLHFHKEQGFPGEEKCSLKSLWLDGFCAAIQTEEEQKEHRSLCKVIDQE
jgi:hypothetical protein